MINLDFLPEDFRKKHVYYLLLLWIFVWNCEAPIL